MEKLKMAILLVNGQHDYHGRLWLEISLANIVKHTSAGRQYKIFVWNNNPGNLQVNEYLRSFGDLVEILDENCFDLDSYDPEKKFRLPLTQGGTLTGGFHPHSTPLQILFEQAVSRYEIDVVFTFDNDACPIRANWDMPLVYALDQGKKITGVWRDELIQVIRPYIHPSCLGIKVETILDLGLRFNQLPVFGEVDTLAHFTYTIIEKYGDDAVFALKRNNGLQYHPVFNGIYGTLIYHHHLGTRNQQGRSKYLRSYGWKERKESMIKNRLIMDGTTEMLFANDADFFNTLAYGDDYLRFKLYLNYLNSNYSKFRAMKLFHLAGNAVGTNPRECFFILTIIQQVLAFEPKFIDLYVKVCAELGLSTEAEAYCSYMKAN